MNYDTAELLCPECGSYLYDKQVNMKQYKGCNSCGYARAHTSPLLSLISDAVGEGINPIKGRPELLRPEDRAAQIDLDNRLIEELNTFNRGIE